MSLPSTVALKSTAVSDYYLNTVDGKPEYSGGLLSPSAKYEIESAKLGGGLVHIRCSYTNQYWVRSGDNGLWITATAKEAVEDTSVWNCTLFRPNLINNNSEVQFVHVQSGVEVRRSVNPSSKWLTINPDDPEIAHSIVVDYETVVILPKVVAFKGYNGKFLKAFYQAFNNMNHLQFEQDTLGSEWVPQEIFPDNDGNISIKNTYFNKFWQCPNQWIRVDADSMHTKETLFQPVKVAGKNMIALRAIGFNSYYLRPLDWSNYFLGHNNEQSVNISKECHFEVFEPVVERTVKHVVYHMDRARIYGHKLLNVATVEDSNTTDTEQESSVKLAYEDKSTKTWNNSNTFSWGVTVSVEAEIPFIGGGGIEVNHEESFTTEWGGASEKTQTTEVTYNMTVPPRTLARITGYVTQSYCDIPYSYVQIDKLADGRILEYKLSDGVFTGVYNYDFHAERFEEPLD